MGTAPVTVFFLCRCAACDKAWAVLTEPHTGCQLWFDQRYYPQRPDSMVSGDGYHCPGCDRQLSGWPGLLTEEGEWVRVITDGACAVLN